MANTKTSLKRCGRCRAVNVIPSHQVGFVCEKCGTHNGPFKKRPLGPKPRVRTMASRRSLTTRRK